MANMEGISPQRMRELYGTKPKHLIGQPDESAEQTALFEWANWKSGKYPELELLYHTPNAGKRTKSAGAKLKREGMRKGIPDIHLPVARGKYHSLYIELKIEGNKPSTEQVWWLAKLKEQGNMAVVCYGYDEAKDTIINYIRGVV